MILKSIGSHGLLLLLSAGIAWRALNHKNASLPAGGAEIWSGNAESLTRIEFENEKKHVVLEGKSDAAGRYGVGSVERVAAVKHEVTPSQAADAGAPPPPSLAPRETLRFVAGKDFVELTEKLSTLRATRDLGTPAPAQLVDYGLDTDKLPHLRVLVNGAVHELLIGASTPGGGDVYAMTADRSRVLVIAGDLVREVESAESRLLERALHAFDDQAATRMLVKTPERSRELIRSTESAAFWTDAASPAGKDETASNWVKNLQRLRVNEYVETPPEAKTLFSVSYLDKQGKPLGTLEFATRKSDPGHTPVPNKDGAEKPATEKSEYWVRTEHTRWWATLIPSTAEPLAQDLASILK